MENKITQLIAALNNLFALGDSGLVANRYDENTVCVEFNGSVNYLINADMGLVWVNPDEEPLEDIIGAVGTKGDNTWV